MTHRKLIQQMRELGRRSAAKRGKPGSSAYKAYYKSLSSAGHKKRWGVDKAAAKVA